jgi:hypothetical protein
MGGGLNDTDSHYPKQSPILVRTGIISRRRWKPILSPLVSSLPRGITNRRSQRVARGGWAGLPGLKTGLSSYASLGAKEREPAALKRLDNFAWLASAVVPSRASFPIFECSPQPHKTSDQEEDVVFYWVKVKLSRRSFQRMEMQNGDLLSS